ncbi:hypothetical protein KUTeg_015029 [Tegillarca granosa]|uniref:SWIM-type domain-containing protein n=1 Tax=Tegillarca granosa TaxID=220873 RepID=A0ABQ9EU61_TEGGR|nr:hypothetical protein KUTeg_015029 [Tegillarca granosa]
MESKSAMAREKKHVTARCWPSMRKNQPPHILFIEIEKPNGSITDGHCSCKAGMSGHCSHVIGLIKSLQGFKLLNFRSVPEQQSCTSVYSGMCHEDQKLSLCRLSHVTENDIKTPESLTGTPLQSRMSPQVPLVLTLLGLCTDWLYIVIPGLNLIFDS